MKLLHRTHDNGSLALARDEIVLLTGEGSPLCQRCAIADRPWPRIRGYLGRSRLRRGEGLLLRPCWSIHTWFLRFRIDIVFLDEDFGVLDVRREVRPFRAAIHSGAAATLELPAGICRQYGVRPGDHLAWGAAA
jgi:uncharacterized membrane protein (UPF0127 family)